MERPDASQWNISEQLRTKGVIPTRSRMVVFGFQHVGFGFRSPVTRRTMMLTPGTQSVAVMLVMLVMLT